MINAPTRLLASFAFLLIVSAGPVFAQKVYYVASEAILNRLPEVRVAKSRLAELQATWTREVQQQEADISTLRLDIDKNRLLWSAQERREADARLRDLEAKLAAYRNAKFGAQGEYEREHSELMKPVFDRVWKAIEEEARAQKVSMVLDKSSRGMSILFADPEYDLTFAVLQRLGIKLDPSEMPQLDPPKGETESNARSNRGRRGRGEATNAPTPETDPNAVLEERREPVSDPDKEVNPD